jgi:tetraacyldisaccharide 4'-kinase
VLGARPFPDHHPYTAGDLDALSREARDRDAILVTTPKDAVRLPPAFRAQVTVIGVGLAWREPKKIDQLFDIILASPPEGMT